MEYFKQFDLKNISIPKAIGFLVIGLIVFVVVVALISFAFRVLIGGAGYGYNDVAYAPSYATGKAVYDTQGEYYEEGLSVRNIAPSPYPPNEHTTGDDAESFEITHYDGYFETGNVSRTCSTLGALKDRTYVIFEHANQSDRGCNYSFKVENERVERVLEVLNDLSPEHLNQNTRTIKNLVDDYTSEIEILEKKLASIEETLTEAQVSYDQVEVLATRTQDVESLAKIIDSKVALIERLTEERIRTKEQIDRINRSKAEQLDRLAYTFFNVHVSEDKIIDLERIVDSWKWELKRVVQELSSMLQALSTGLLVFLFKAIPIAIYLIAALFILKYGWRGAKYMWRR